MMRDVEFPTSKSAWKDLADRFVYFTLTFAEDRHRWVYPFFIL